MSMVGARTRMLLALAHVWCVEAAKGRRGRPFTLTRLASAGPGASVQRSGTTLPLNTGHRRACPGSGRPSSTASELVAQPMPADYLLGIIVASKQSRVGPRPQTPLVMDEVPARHTLPTTLSGLLHPVVLVIQVLRRIGVLCGTPPPQAVRDPGHGGGRGGDEGRCCLAGPAPSGESKPQPLDITATRRLLQRRKCALESLPTSLAQRNAACSSRSGGVPLAAIVVAAWQCVLKAPPARCGSLGRAAAHRLILSASLACSAGPPLWASLRKVAAQVFGLHGAKQGWAMGRSSRREGVSKDGIRWAPQAMGGRA